MKTVKMHGWLVVNGFLKTGKFGEVTQWFLIASGRMGISLRVFTNIELLVGIPMDEKPDFVLFWDKDINLARYLEQLGYAVFNSSESIADCDDKGKTYIKLLGTGIPQPKTILAPFTYGNIGYDQTDFLSKVQEKLTYPMVLKESFGSFGMQVYLIHDEHELRNKVMELQPKPMLFQEYLSAYAGSDLRLQVVGDRVVACMLRYSEKGDFRANVTLGGKMERYTPSKEQIDIACSAVKTLSLTFGGVDLLFGMNEEPILCEVNSNAHFKSIFECTKVNVAEEILHHVIRLIS